MSISQLSDDLNIIAKLDEEPNDEGGLSSAAFRAKFDEAGNAIKTYINGTLIPAIISDNVPFTSTVGVPASTVQAAVENVQGQIASVALGEIPDGTITGAKLATGAVTETKIADDSVTIGKLAAVLKALQFYGKTSQMSGGAGRTTAGMISFSTEDSDDFSAIDIATYSTRITIPAGISKARLYCYVTGRFASSDSSNAITLYKNGQVVQNFAAYTSDAYYNFDGYYQTQPLAVTSGDYFEVYAKAQYLTAGAIFGMEVLG